MHPPPPPSEPSFSPWRRLAIGGSVLLATASVLALAFMANYLAHHYAPRWYFGAAGDHRLSPLTRGALEGLTNHIRITVFFDRQHPVYPSVRALLREYAAASPRLTIEEIDFTTNPAAAQAFRLRVPFTLDENDPALVLFESGGRSKVVPARDLRDYDTAALIRGEPEAHPVAFKGELLFTSAINAVCEGSRRRVFFLEGHREHDFRSDAPQTGYRHLASLLEEDHIDVAGLSLAGRDDVPAECELLVIAGPQDPLTPGELSAIDRYLRRGGRLLVLFQHRSHTGLERLLADWGVDVADTLVLDAENSDRAILIVTRFGNHPVTRPLGGSRLYLLLPRAVQARRLPNILGAPARIEPLLRTGSNGVAVSTFVGGAHRFGPDDPQGEIPLAVAVERGALPGVAASLGTTRIVVVGESSFLANQLIQFVGGNRHFATSAINWLLDRSHLLGGIQPAPIRTYQVVMTPAEQHMIRLLLLVALPGGALAFGFLVWWRRH
ncbi:MAG: GldG family protein [Verrucomicrobiae bacterium]|nr:GldG family protein [Verrucomicrobiae bacterium]